MLKTIHPIHLFASGNIYGPYHTEKLVHQILFGLGRRPRLHWVAYSTPQAP